MPSIGTRRPLLPAILIAWLSVAALPGHAQPPFEEVPDAIMAKDGAWSADEAATMRRLAEAPGAAMRGQDAAAVVDGRDALLAPMRQLGATPSFLRQYYRLLADQMAGVMAEGTAVGKVNALVVAEFVPDAAILPMVNAALGDANAGVRFAAARAVGKLLPNPGLNLNDAALKRQIDQVVEQAMVEPDAYVAGKLLEALAGSTVPDKRSQTLRVLNARVDLHGQDPTLSYQPEFVNMQELFINGLGQFAASDAREFVRAATRCLRLVAHQLNDGVLPAEAAEAAASLALQADTVLHELGFGALRLNPANRPGRAANAIAVKNWGELVQIGERWHTLLQEAQPGFQPFNADDLRVLLPGDAPAAEAPAEVAADQ